jgi:ATP-binding cassette, subfamily B, multidrug efflux pump
MLVKLLRTYLSKYQRELGAVVVLQLIATAAALYLPYLNAHIVDRGIVRGDNGYIRATGLIMLAVSLLQIAFSVGAVYFGARAAMGFGRDVRSNLFHTVTGYSTREVNHFGAPSLITRITNDVQQVQVLVLLSCTLMVAAPLTIVGGVIMALREDIALSAILLVSVPALVVAVGYVVARMVPQYRVMQARIDSVNQVLREQVTGMRVVRAFVREPAEALRFEGVNALVSDAALKAGRLMAFMFPIVVVILNASSVAALWIGAGRIEDGVMSIGALIAFLTYLVQILMSIMFATFMAVMIPRASVCAERIQEVLDTPSSVVLPTDPVRAVDEHGSLEFVDVGFHYPGAEAAVLSNISFRSLAGRTTAIIGSTGSGKTTLVNLIARLADATSGSVLVDGIDVRALDPEMLWTRIGLVPQKPYLFSGTVASNLRYGKSNATDDEIWDALTVAQARDFVAAMPDGLDGRIEQGGSNVSGGQRQRLAIARALIGQPEIYVFDDSFSALDLATDARLRAALAPHTRDATVIIVAQRVSTIATADQIIVLEHGEMVGIGTHQELLDHCPTYLEIVESQTTSAAR